MADPSPEAMACAEAISSTLFYSDKEPGKPGVRYAVGMEKQAVAELVQKALDAATESFQCGHPRSLGVDGNGECIFCLMTRCQWEWQDETSRLRSALEVALAAAEQAHAICRLESCMLCATIRAQREILR